jgi:hypothetical protein
MRGFARNTAATRWGVKVGRVAAPQVRPLTNDQTTAGAATQGLSHRPSALRHSKPFGFLTNLADGQNRVAIRRLVAPTLFDWPGILGLLGAQTSWISFAYEIVPMSRRTPTL